MISVIKRYVIASLVGAGLSLVLLLTFTMILRVIPDGVVRDVIAKPFLAICYPILNMGETIYGQAPIPVLLFLCLCWILFGFIIGLAIAMLMNAARGVKGVKRGRAVEVPVKHN